MAANVEQIGALERRLQMSVPMDGIEREIDLRLKKMARNAKMPGFRPGKVPMKLLAQTYGPQLRSEVLGDAVQKAFTDAVREAKGEQAEQLIDHLKKTDMAKEAERLLDGTGWLP